MNVTTSGNRGRFLPPVIALTVMSVCILTHQQKTHDLLGKRTPQALLEGRTGSHRSWFDSRDVHGLAALSASGMTAIKSQMKTSWQR